ncbi:MAG: hypothetical protein BGO69_08370 [Bacteroidetes bacterium 46-16]|nr:MAG: hypothetical protein BGO69_08370 [Bacteroidetes bacterium 46-16]
MKRFVLSCCILAVSTTMVFAQAAKKTTSPNNNNATLSATKNNTATTRVTAKDLMAKANEFEAEMTRNNRDLADQRAEDLKTMMTNDLHSIKPKIMNAPNDTEKNKWMGVLNKKQTIYFDIIAALHDKLGNKDLIVKKCREYAATL